MFIYLALYLVEYLQFEKVITFPVIAKMSNGSLLYQSLWGDDGTGAAERVLERGEVGRGGGGGGWTRTCKLGGGGGRMLPWKISEIWVTLKRL